MHEEELMDTDHGKKDTKKSALERFEDLIGSADLKPDVFQKLGQGFQTLSDTTSKIADISNASVATQEYVGSLKNASTSFNSLNESYNKSVLDLNQNASQLSNSYSKTAELITNSGTNLASVVNNVSSSIAEKIATSGNDLADNIQKAGQQITNTYKQLSDSMSAGAGSIVDNNKSYAAQLEHITKNLSALNSIYELQLKGTNEQLKATEQLYGGLHEMMQNLKDSVEDTQKYRAEVSKLGQNLGALNTIYGNMLSAMNFNKA
jgi:DNA repair ATPase RecN